MGAPVDPGPRPGSNDCHRHSRGPIGNECSDISLEQNDIYCCTTYKNCLIENLKEFIPAEPDDFILLFRSASVIRHRSNQQDCQNDHQRG